MNLDQWMTMTKDEQGAWVESQTDVDHLENIFMNLTLSILPALDMVETLAVSPGRFEEAHALRLIVNEASQLILQRIVDLA